MACTNLILKKVVEKIKNEITKGELSGVEDNYRNGTDCEKFLMEIISDHVTNNVFCTPGSRSKFDVIAIENKQRGVIFHFIQVKSSGSKNNIKKYNGDLKSEMTKQANRLKKIAGIKVIGHSISWARIYNPQNGEKELVDISIIKGSTNARNFYEKLATETKVIKI